MFSTSGLPADDHFTGCPLLTRAQLEREMGFRLDGPVALVTYHPATLDRSSIDTQIGHLVAAIKSCKIKAIFTMANADAQGARINARLSALCAHTPGQFESYLPSGASPLPELPAALRGHGGEFFEWTD